MKKFRFLFVLALSIGLRAKAEKETLNFLSYSSFVGPGSLGEWLEKNPQGPCAHYKCVFKTPHPSRSLFEELRSGSENKASQPDIIIGMDELQRAWALEAGLISKEGVAIGKSPLVLLFKKSALKGKNREFSWKELPKTFKNAVVIQDPRFSALGQVLLSFGVKTQMLKPKELREITRRVFPKWSASYRYFLESEAPALLTFATTKAYHECQKKGPELEILQLKEGFPLYQEWAAPVQSADPKKAAGVLETLKFFESSDFQKEVMARNWLLPSNASVRVPDCYQSATKLKVTPFSVPTRKEFQSWTDEWSL